MSIPNTIDLIEEHIENAYNALETGGADLTNVNKNLTNINSQLINRYEDYLANGTDVIWNNWENKSTQEGENLNFNNTIKAKMQIELKGNATQTNTPTPEVPQDIHVVTGDNTLYITQNLCDGDLLRAVVSTNNFQNRTNRVATRHFMKVTPSSTCYINFKTTNNVDEYNVSYFTSNAFPRSSEGGWTSLATNKTFSIPTGINYILITFRNSRDADIQTTDITDIVVANSIQTQLLSLGSIELAKIGDYQDKIYKNNSKWYLEKNIEKIENYNGETIDTNYISSTGGLDIGATVYYQLTTPTITEITDEILLTQLADLEKIKSYNNQTNIFQENADISFIINATILLNE